MNAITQEITVETDGVLEVRSPTLHTGDVVEVTVLAKPIKPATVATIQDTDWEDLLGSFEPGDPDGSNNEKIDRDLAAAYLDSHEPDK